MGCVGVRTQAGQIMIGSRSTSARISSNDRLPLPITMPLRSSTTGTPDARSTTPVSCRLRRCRERPASAPSPPTYTMRRTPAARAAAPKWRAAARSWASKSRAPPKRVDQIVGGLDPGQRRGQRVRIQAVAVRHARVRPDPALEGGGPPGHAAHGAAGRLQGGEQPPADAAGGAGQQDRGPARRCVDRAHERRCRRRRRQGVGWNGPGRRRSGCRGGYGRPPAPIASTPEVVRGSA